MDTPNYGHSKAAPPHPFYKIIILVMMKMSNITPSSKIFYYFLHSISVGLLS